MRTEMTKIQQITHTQRRERDVRISGLHNGKKKLALDFYFAGMVSGTV